MTAPLATVDECILARAEEVGNIRDGSVIPRSAGDKPQVGGMQFDCGYLSPYFQIVSYFIAVRMGAKKDAIRWVLKLIEFHKALL